MNLRAKKALSLSAALMLILSGLLAGCASSSSTAPATTSQATTSTATVAPSPTTSTVAPSPAAASTPFIIWMGQEKKCPEVTQVQNIFKEKLGFDFKVQSLQGDLMTTLNLKLNSGGFEDLAEIYYNDTAINAFVKSGLIMEAGPLLQQPDKYMNLAKMPESVVKYSTGTDGKLWYVPCWYAQEMDNPWPGWVANAWFVQSDIVEKAGMKMEDLSTMEGFEKYLSAAAQLKTADGKAIIPLGFWVNDGTNLNKEEDVILSTFGVDMAVGASGMPGVKTDGTNFVFAYDDPNFKAAYQWINKEYSAGLVDIEVPTMKKERYQEKLNSGTYAVISGSFWNAGLNNTWATLSGPTGPTGTTWYLTPIKAPTVSGVSAPGALGYVNPYPGACAFISKNTKNLDSILKFLDWTHEPEPSRQQEVNEGPVGTTWHWTGDPLGEWDFDPAYGAERNSGDQARVDACTPQLWMLSTFSNKWYPWWTNVIGADKPEGMKFITKHMKTISAQNNTQRVMHVYDAVPKLSGGVIEKYLPTLNAVYIEYRAKLIMAKKAAEFDSIWAEFTGVLESRAHWSEMKAEWQQQYTEYVKTHNPY